MAEHLGENNRHQVARFVSFFKGKRDRFSTLLRERRDDTKSDRLNDDIYPHADVEQHLDFLAEELHDLGKEELQRNSQISAAYVAELLLQAQQANVELSVDISIVEDEKKMQGVTDIFNTALTKPPTLKKNALSALGNEGPDVNSLQEIQDLRAEHQVLQDRNVQMQQQLTQLLSERQVAWDELDTVKIDFLTYKRDVDDRLACVNMGSSDVKDQLADTQGVLAQKRDELVALQNDMTKRINETSQFKDLKNIVAKKNTIIKDLRLRLLAYEPDEAGMIQADD